MNKQIGPEFLKKKKEKTEKKNNVQFNYYYLWHLVALNILQVKESLEAETADGTEDPTLRKEPCPKIEGTVWDVIGKPGKAGNRPADVALIDVGVSMLHPNLSSRIDVERSIDLTVGRAIRQYPVVMPGAASTGADSYPRPNFPDDTKLSEMCKKLGLDQGYGNLFKGAIKYVADADATLQNLTHGDETFSSHGTSVAGLIVGEPAVVRRNGGGKDGDGLKTLSPDDAFFGAEVKPPDRNPNGEHLPYFGADPFSRLVSIKTSFEDEPLQFIAAFVYAWHNDVDVIVLPRGIPDPVRRHLNPKSELKADLEKWKNRNQADMFHRLADAGNATGLSASKGTLPGGRGLKELVDEIADHLANKMATRMGDALDETLDAREPDPHEPFAGFTANKLWKILKHLIIAVSKEIPIVCAAGNDGESQLIYPANLAADENGIIAVGSVTAEGFRSGCSNYGDQLTLVAPSDDCEVYNRHQLRIDWKSQAAKAHDYKPGRGQEYAYSHLELVTTDLPGAFGYSDSNAFDPYALPTEDNLGRLGGFFTAFGGTSGAAALVGGVAALVKRAYRASRSRPGRLSGTDVKEILKKASDLDTIVYPGRRPLTPDNMNARHESAGEKPEYFFGAGLVDAAKAVKFAQKAK